MMKTAFDKLSEEFDGVNDATVKEKSAEQFRQEIVGDIFRMILEKTDRSISFVRKADYLNAKLTDAKIEGLHEVLDAILNASTINVKER